MRMRQSNLRGHQHSAARLKSNTQKSVEIKPDFKNLWNLPGTFSHLSCSEPDKVKPSKNPKELEKKNHQTVCSDGLKVGHNL